MFLLFLNKFYKNHDLHKPNPKCKPRANPKSKVGDQIFLGINEEIANHDFYKIGIFTK
jgi:hypothetical protein